MQGKLRMPLISTTDSFAGPDLVAAGTPQAGAWGAAIEKTRVKPLDKKLRRLDSSPN